jgi:hypothetical protein
VTDRHPSWPATPPPPNVPHIVPPDPQPALHHSGPQHPAMPHPGSQHSGLQHSGLQHSGSQHSGLQHSGLQHSGLQHPALQHPALQHPGVQQPGVQQPGVQQPGVQQPGVQHLGPPPGLPHAAAAYAHPGAFGRPVAYPPPSGLFPGPSRPVYREPHPITAASVLAGIGATLLWLGLFGGLAHGLAAYAWWTIVAAVCAWAVALVLAVLGDRGVAVGVAIASGTGLSIAVAFVAARWIGTYDWPLW